MPSAPIPIPEAAAERRKRFTVAEVERLLDLGFFEGERYELIDGDLLVKHGQSPQHAYSIHRGMAALIKAYPPERVLCQMPVQAAGADAEHSLPEPDLGALREFTLDHAPRHPRGNELLLAIEVSDSTLAFDRVRKAALYAHAGIPEYWVLDLNNRTLVTHQNPDGVEYGRVLQYHAEETIRFPGRPAADGATRKEALANAEVTISEWIETAKELGRPIPEPRGRLLFA